MLVIWLTFLGELEDDEKNLLYVAVSRAKKSLRLSQKIVNLLHLQKVLSLITMLSCCFLVVCFLSKCTTYFQKRRSTQVRVQNFLPLRSVFESFNSSLKHQRDIIPETMAKWLWNVVIPLEIRNLFFVVANSRFCPSTCTHSRKGHFSYFLTLESVLRDRFVRIRVNRRAIWRKTILFQVKMNACGGLCLAQPKWSNYK